MIHQPVQMLFLVRMAAPVVEQAAPQVYRVRVLPALVIRVVAPITRHLAVAVAVPMLPVRQVVPRPEEPEALA
jgi:hypothetical protein